MNLEILILFGFPMIIGSCALLIIVLRACEQEKTLKEFMKRSNYKDVNCTNSSVQQKIPSALPDSTSKFQDITEPIRVVNSEKINFSFTRKDIFSMSMSGLMAYGIFHSIALALFSSLLSLLLSIGLTKQNNW